MPLLDGLAERNVLPVVDEEGVLLVVCDDVINAWEGEGPHGVMAVRGRVNVEMLAATGGRDSK